MKIERCSGVLLHPTSLPSQFGIGDLGPGALFFLEWAASAGQRLWQVLPLGPTGLGGSPYGCHSAFAGNPLLLSPESLVTEGLLDADSLDGAPFFAQDHVDYQSVTRWKTTILRRSWELFRRAAPAPAREEHERFVHAPDNGAWLPDWALYCALKSRMHGKPWCDWDAALRWRAPESLKQARQALADEIAFHQYQQFLFFRQWDRVRAAALSLGIRIMGDLPIYLAYDSADVWANPSSFVLNEDGLPSRIAGVPPDYFSSTGQLWGNPLYRWDRMEQDGFSWWIERVRANLRLADIVRLDHFRGFAAYWEVDASEKTARNGRWAPGPGARLFETLRRELGELPLVAEDLGLITPDVTELRRQFSLPGMAVLQFGFGDEEGDHTPHRHTPDTVVYTGTHDNDTTRGWFRSLTKEKRRRVREMLNAGTRPIERVMIETACASPARIAVIPLQDVLGLGSEARMNTPGIAAGNWTWRVTRGQLRAGAARRMREIARRTGRFPADADPTVKVT